MTLDGNSRILLTGASGFVGQSILDHISNSEEVFGKMITLIVNQSQPHISNQIKNKYEVRIIQSDLTNEWEFSGNFTHFINLAGDGTRNPYSVQSGERFLNISRHAANWINSRDLEVFHASSGATLGYFPIDKKSKNIWTKKDFISFRLKAENEFLSKAGPHMRIRIGRLYSFIGPQLLGKKQYAINQFIDGANLNGLVELKGDPQTIRSYLWADDMAKWILRSIQAPASSILNIGSSVKVSMLELAQYVACQAGANIEISENFEPGDIYVAQNADTLKLLGVSESLTWKQQVDEVMKQNHMEE